MKHSSRERLLNFCRRRVKSCWSRPKGRDILTVVAEDTNILSLHPPKRESVRTLSRTLGANLGENWTVTVEEALAVEGAPYAAGRMDETPLMPLSLSASRSLCFSR